MAVNDEVCDVAEVPTLSVGVTESIAVAGSIVRGKGKGKTQGVYFGDLDVIPWKHDLDPPPHACFFCCGRDHGCRDCLWPVEPCCLNCGRWGVSVASCPRRKNRWFGVQGETTRMGSRPWSLAREERRLQQQLTKVARRTGRSVPAPSRASTPPVEPQGNPPARYALFPMREPPRDLPQAIRLAELLAGMSPEALRLYRELNGAPQP